MTQSEAHDACTQMADAHARKGNPDDHSRVHQSVFSQAYEFIPAGATWAVIDNDGESPRLVALDDLKLYTLTVGDLGGDSLGVPTSSRFAHIDPQKATVECENEFTGHRGKGPMARETTWTFDLDGFGLTISTEFSPDRARMSREEILAQQIAEAVGWADLPRVELKSLAG